MFEQATRLHLRFTTNRGLVTVEDLWDMPLTSRSGFDLDAVARHAHKELKESEETVSFVVKTTKANETKQLAFDLVKHVIDVKLAEQAAATEASARKENKQKLLALIEDKKDESLKQKTVEELQEMVAAL